MLVSLLLGVSVGSIFLCFLIGLLHFKSLGAEIRWFFYFIAVASFFEAVMTAHALLKLHNLLYFNIYLLVETCWLFLLLLKWLVPGIRLAYMVVIALAFSINWCLTIYKEGTDIISPAVMLTGNSSLFLISGVYIVHFIRKTDSSPFRNSHFWIATGIFIYFASTCLVAVSANYVFAYHHEALSRFNAYFHSIVNLICNMIYSIGFLCQKSKQRYP